MVSLTELKIDPRRGALPELRRSLVAEISREWLDSFGEKYQDQANGLLVPATIGKFVAFHELVVVAPFPVAVIHQDLMNSARELMPERVAEERAKAEAASVQFLGSTSLTDGGHFQLVRNENGQVTSFYVAGESAEFGRGNDAVRQTTVYAIRQAVGDIVVSV